MSTGNSSFQKKIAFFLVALGVTVSMGLVLYWSPLKQSLVVKDNRLHELLKMRDLYNNPISSIKTEFIIINFWASWCPPCVEETPSLIHFTERYQKHFTLFALSQDSAKKEIENFVKIFPSLRSKAVTVIHDDSQSLARSFSVNKLPETFVYSLSQNKYMQLSGSTDWDRPEVIEAIKKYFHAQLD